MPKNITPHLVVLSSSGATKDLITILEIQKFMILQFENLEALVSAEEEIKLAIRQVREKDLVNTVEEEFDEPVQSVVEQELDTVTFEESDSYMLQVHYGNETTTTHYERPYVESNQRENRASYQVISEHDGQMLQAAQDIATQVKHGQLTNRPYLDATLDDRKRHIIESIKTTSITLWFEMCEGKITFT